MYELQDGQQATDMRVQATWAIMQAQHRTQQITPQDPVTTRPSHQRAAAEGAGHGMLHTAGAIVMCKQDPCWHEAAHAKTATPTHMHMVHASRRVHDQAADVTQ